MIKVNPPSELEQGLLPEDEAGPTFPEDWAVDPKLAEEARRLVPDQGWRRQVGKIQIIADKASLAATIQASKAPAKKLMVLLEKWRTRQDNGR